MIYRHKMYNNTIELCFDEEKHTYYTENPNKPEKNIVDGVTSILKVISKPALVYWSANKAGEFIERFLPVGKVIDEVEKQRLVKGCKTAHKTLLEDAGNLGTMLHELVEKYIKKQPYNEPVNDILKASFENFKEWVKKHNVEFKSSERVVYSKKYNYAGTLDATAIVDGKKCLIDLKTSSGIWDEYFLQCSAYQHALQEEYPEIDIDHTIIIRCGKDGKFEKEPAYKHKENFEAFLGALCLYRRLKDMKFERKQGGNE